MGGNGTTPVHVQNTCISMFGNFHRRLVYVQCNDRDTPLALISKKDKV